jgi:hypothetical protein
MRNRLVRTSRRAGFAVASLLLLTAVVAIYAAAIMSARNMEPAPDWAELAAFGVVGLAFGLISGFFLGLFFGTRNRDMALGVVEGAVFGPPTVVLLAVPDSLPVVLIGGVVLVGFALVVRYLSPGRNASQEGDDSAE